MERIAKFEKVSFEQYSEAVRGIAPERSDEEIRSLYNGIKLPKRATEGSAARITTKPRKNRFIEAR